MSVHLWKNGSEDQLRTHIRSMDARFQRAMRQELRDLAADRGMVLIEKRAPLPKSARRSVPRDVIRLSPSVVIEMPQTDGQRIVLEVCEKHGFTRQELFGERRGRPLVAARHEAMYRLSKETSMSFPAIGRRMGGRDHSTVIHGVRQHERRLLEAAAQ